MGGLIAFIIIIAHYFENVEIFRKVGEITLYLCCSEYLAKVIISCFTSLISLNLKFDNNALGIYVYTVLIIIFIYKVLYPYEKKLLERIYKSLKLDNH